MGQIKISSPHRFQERICAFGYEGAGKSSLSLNILKYQLDAHLWVFDLDYSFAYDRLIATEYPEVEDRVHIINMDTEWEELEEGFKQLHMDGRPERGDWLTIDPTTATWQMVQSWYSDQVHGEDISDHLLGIRKASQDARNAATNKQEEVDAKKQYGRDVLEDMTWPLINKVYQRKFYGNLHKWRGNFVLVCEAESVRKDASPEEKDVYGFIGHKPKGQKTLPFVAATNIYLDHPKRDEWRLTSVKDRGRELVEKLPVTEFAIDYLVEIGGWTQEYVK